MPSIPDNLFQVSKEKPLDTGMSLGLRCHTQHQLEYQKRYVPEEEEARHGQWRKTVHAITDDSADDYFSDLEHWSSP